MMTLIWFVEINCEVFLKEVIDFLKILTVCCFSLQCNLLDVIFSVIVKAVTMMTATQALINTVVWQRIQV